MKKKKKSRRSTRGLTTLDEFLKDQGTLEEFEAVAIKEVIAWQISEEMRLQNLSRKRLAERMKTSRSQIGRLLDPKDGNVTIATLQRAAKVVGRTLRVELIQKINTSQIAGRTTRFVPRSLGPALRTMWYKLIETLPSTNITRALKGRLRHEHR